MDEFKDEKTGNVIHAPLNDTLIHGSMRNCDLVPAFMDALRDTPEYVQLMNSVPNYAADDERCHWWISQDAYCLGSELFDVMEDYAQDGYCFGAHVGDGSDYGYWECDLEEGLYES